MATLMSRDHMKASRETEANDSNEWVLKVHPREIDIRVVTEEAAHPLLLTEKCLDRFPQAR